ncbi:MAG: Mpv17/PMP22 family protein [Bacteroidales bacterium]|nr:Mpv17/PMP22 family protein [Bacteroidales bacterium]
MNKKDLLVLILLVIIFTPFILIEPAYAWFLEMSKNHGMLMSFLKFAVLATVGEAIGYRIRRGEYPSWNFGYLPKLIIWGVLGCFIFIAFKVFGIGIPLFLEYMGLKGATASMSQSISWIKVVTAFGISFFMNLIFAPVLMTTHKITDTHIENHQGKLNSLFKPIHVSRILKNLDWNVHWGFVLKKTIPYFWIPAHTITFLLPEEFRVLFAAILSMVLGIFLAFAAQLSKKKH